LCCVDVLPPLNSCGELGAASFWHPDDIFIFHFSFFNFVDFCHDSAIGKAFLLRTSANQTGLLALGLASVQASLIALAAPKVHFSFAIVFRLRCKGTTFF